MATDRMPAANADTTDSGYVSVGLLARGGMGEVELGLRTIGSFRRLVAIKRLRSEHRSDPSFRRMFLDEAKIAGLIRHPNVVSVLDVGDDPDRGPFLIMDYVEGVHAGHLLQSASTDDEPPPVQIATRIVHQICLGLAAAHTLTHPDGSSLNLIHRDISPQNILIGFDGVARLTDFGIAKALGTSKNTTTGLLKGKVGYMSPEQLRFERPTQKSDLFSLGVVLYELLSANRLYAGKDTVDVAQRILSEPTPDIYAVRDDVPDALVELSFELLAKDPADRPPDARNVADRLAEIVDELAAMEGGLRLDEYLAVRFAAERTALAARSESLVREWEVTTSHSPPPEGARSRTGLWAAMAATAVAGAALAYGAVAWLTGPEPVEAPAEPEPNADVAASPEETSPTETAMVELSPEPAPIAEEATAEPGPGTAQDDGTAVPASDGTGNTDRAAARRAARARMRRARGMRAMRGDEGFSAIDLIRGTM